MKKLMAKYGYTQDAAGNWKKGDYLITGYRGEYGNLWHNTITYHGVILACTIGLEELSDFLSGLPLSMPRPYTCFNSYISNKIGY